MGFILSTRLRQCFHRKSRRRSLVSRFGDDSPEWRSISAKLLAIFQVAQGGTLFLYQGEEIGMKNMPKTWGLEEYKDIAGLRFYKQYVWLLNILLLESWITPSVKGSSDQAGGFGEGRCRYVGHFPRPANKGSRSCSYPNASGCIFN